MQLLRAALTWRLKLWQQSIERLLLLFGLFVWVRTNRVSDLESPYGDSKGITLSVLLILFSCQRTDLSSKRAAILPFPSLRVKRNVSAPREPIPVDPDRRNSSLFRLLERTACVAGDCGFYVLAAVFVNRLLAAGNGHNWLPSEVISSSTHPSPLPEY